MTLNYSVPGHVSFDMSHYVEKMVKEFPQENLEGASVASPWNENLFKVQHNSAPLERNKPSYSTLWPCEDCFYAGMVAQMLHQQ